VYFKYGCYLLIALVVVLTITLAVIMCTFSLTCAFCCKLYKKVVSEIRPMYSTKMKDFLQQKDLVFCFTDIKYSTWLWENKHKQMKQAIVIYNLLVNDLIEKYDGYCVKNLGDGHFICFRSPEKSIHFSMELQRRLMMQSWPSKLLKIKGVSDQVISQSYIPPNRIVYTTNDSPFSSTSSSFSENGNLVFYGLRIKIGLNMGSKFEINKNKETRRFDFLGTSVNKASRMENKALGGQVLISNVLFEKTKHLFNKKQTTSSVQSFANKQTLRCMFLSYQDHILTRKT